MRAVTLRRFLFVPLLAILSMSGCTMNQPSLDPPQPVTGPNFWIGEVGPIGPIFTGPHQQPFICMTFREGLGQSLIDNQDGEGSAVYRETVFGPFIWGFPLGYSRDCSAPTRVDYFYYSAKHEKFLPLKNHNKVPDDVERITVNDQEIDFIVRAERGTINRFIYSIAMLAPFEESLESPQTLNNSAWNGKLVYKFQGGVGIGHWQGRMRFDKKHALNYDSLKRGYAVAFSTGTSTTSHYNLKLSEETALMVKEHFETTYGKPIYTVGMGGSGGAIQQYILGQNNDKILDAAIAQLSFPDMVTQINYVSDCDLLERYFDQKYQEDPESKWGDWEFREKIEGVASTSEALQNGRFPNPMAPSPGASTCSRNWRGQTQNVMNPEWKHPAYDKAFDIFSFPEDTTQKVKWTHWNDLGNIYPQDENGFAATTWDNIGVQYGLTALRNRLLDVDEFLELNACVGSWKPAPQQKMGKYPWDNNASKKDPDHWDVMNMRLSPNCKTGAPAPRYHADDEAIRIAYESGQVFTGNIDIPIIDVRWHLDPVLDIHHSLGSFSARARIDKHNGNHDNQLIWVAACESMDLAELKRECPYNPTDMALDVLEVWLTTGKPHAAYDACLDYEGQVIYSGDDAWDGILDDKPAGPCTKQFPIHTTSRIEAGEDMRGELFKCPLKSVEQAISEGDYGNNLFTEEQTTRLKAIFPDGVCDYSE